MPLYEYQCEKCGKVFEVMQKFSDEPLTTHAECGGAVQRLVSAPAFQFKGSGWYVTDYAKSGKPGSNGPAAKSEGTETKAADGGSPSAGEKTTSSPSSSETKSTSSETK